MIYMNNSQISPAQITPLALPFSDTVAVIKTMENAKPSLFINVYNLPDNSIFIELHEHLQRVIRVEDYHIIIL